MKKRRDSRALRINAALATANTTAYLYREGQPVARIQRARVRNRWLQILNLATGHWNTTTAGNTIDLPDGDRITGGFQG